jgi:adenylate cyclase
MGQNEESRIRRFAEAAKRADSNPRAVEAARRLRALLPGDKEFGDPLSTAGSDQAHLAGRRLSALTAKRPGVLREAGLSALQVWQSFSEAQGRGRGEVELAIVFTDLVDFSDWALGAGDDAALKLLRDVGRAIEPPVEQRGGEVVKRLGDGMMAVFAKPDAAFAALCDARDRLGDIRADGYTPHIRAGMHVGRPRKIGGDYLGVDVNIAARIADSAGAGEIVLSDRALACLDGQTLDSKRKRRFKVKGVPKDLEAYVVAPKRT